MLRKWRIHVYDGDYEILPERTLLLSLDLDDPVGLQRAEIDLESMRVVCAMRARVSLESVRLAVCDERTDVIALDWLGRA